MCGYGLGGLSKPLFALAGGPGLIVTARLIERVGEGMRGAPRDALVADMAPPAERGAAFGLRQSLDTVGHVSRRRRVQPGGADEIAVARGDPCAQYGVGRPP